MREKDIAMMYEAAVRRYREIGVDVEAALDTLNGVPVSMHCWQGDDVAGFEAAAGGASGGILTTPDAPATWPSCAPTSTRRGN